MSPWTDRLDRLLTYLLYSNGVYLYFSQLKFRFESKEFFFFFFAQARSLNVFENQRFSTLWADGGFFSERGDSGILR